MARQTSSDDYQPILRQQTLFWLVFFVFVGVVLAFLGDVLLPFILGIIAAYLFNPLIDNLKHKGVPRAVSSLLVILLIFIVVVGTWAIIIPLVSGQFFGLVGKMPEYWDTIKGWAYPSMLIEKTKAMIPDSSVFSTTNEVQNFFEKNIGSMWKGVSGVVGNLWAGGRILFGLLSYFIITPVVAFYMMRDWPEFVQKVDDMLPLKYHGSIKMLLKEFDETLSGFIRGQALVCLLLGLFYAVALSLVGLNFAIVIGLVAGVLSFIPYVGSIVGLVSSVGVAIFQFQDITMTAIVLGIFIVGQLVEGNYLTPKLVGKRVGLHAVWVLLALMVGGSLFGFVGVVVAVPVAALLGVLIRFGMSLYKQSELYSGPKTKEEAIQEKKVKKAIQSASKVKNDRK